MVCSEAVTQVVGRDYNVPALDADYLELRARAMDDLDQSVAELWVGMPSWRRASATVVIGANVGFGLLPATFQAVGDRRNGGVWLVSTGDRLDPIAEHEMREIKEVPGGGLTAEPEEYSIYGQDPTTYVPLIHIPMNSVALSLKVAFESVKPTLTDGGANDNDLQRIPVQYHQSCVILLMRERAKERRGDRGANFESAVERALRFIRRQERPGSDGPAQMPSFFGR